MQLSLPLRSTYSYPVPQTGLQGPCGPGATFQVDKIGEVWCLHLAPITFEALGPALGIAPDDVAWVRYAPGVEAMNVAWSALAHLRPDAEVVHLPAGTDLQVRALKGLPEPLLLDPQRAVAHSLGSRVSIAIADQFHGTVFTKEPEIVSASLRALVNQTVLNATKASTALPDIPVRALSSWVEPLPPDGYCLLEMEIRQRFWTMHFEQNQGSVTINRERWICEGEGGRWRAGWAW